ncbi:hypothetical protein [Kribbella deserti]|uniref:Uncharacterized protein n=1 Tax=Kribbella deserti TaxID=1926257 RepID=A0ABV6QU66_9ACTN
MTGIVVLTVLALALIAALEISNRRHSSQLGRGLNGSTAAGDRDLARTKLDLLALGAAAEPFSHKPMAQDENVLSLRATRTFTHRHAA